MQTAIRTSSTSAHSKQSTTRATEAEHLQGLIASTVPEPSSLVLLLFLPASVCRLGMFERAIELAERRCLSIGIVVAAWAAAGVPTSYAQVFTLTTPAVPTSCDGKLGVWRNVCRRQPLSKTRSPPADIGVKQYTPPRPSTMPA